MGAEGGRLLREEGKDGGKAEMHGEGSRFCGDGRG